MRFTEIGVAMNEIPEQRCASIGMRVSLLCVTMGVIAPAGIMLHEFFQFFNWSILKGVLATLFAVYLAALLLGRNAGKIICRGRRSFGRVISVGIGLALSCLAVGAAVTAGFGVAPTASSSWVEKVFGVWLLSALIWLIGALPAILLGMLYGVMVRWRLTKAEFKGEA